MFCQLLFAQCKCFFSLKQPHPLPPPSERELHSRFHKMMSCYHSYFSSNYLQHSPSLQERGVRGVRLDVLLSFPLFIELSPALPLSAGEGVRGVRLEVLLSFPLFVELFPALPLSAGEGDKGVRLLSTNSLLSLLAVPLSMAIASIL